MVNACFLSIKRLPYGSLFGLEIKPAFIFRTVIRIKKAKAGALRRQRVFWGVYYGIKRTHKPSSALLLLFNINRFFRWKERLVSYLKGGKVMPVVNVGFQVLPKVADDKVYAVVDKAIEVVQKSGVKYEVGAMETVMEGELDHLIEIVKKAQEVCVEAGASEVMTYIKIHYRPEGVSMDEKLAKYR